MGRSQDPDLIVVTYHDIDETMYELLSAIAPRSRPARRLRGVDRYMAS